MSERIYVNKTDGLREHIICYHWYFLKVNFRFQPKVCDGYYYLMHKAMSFNVVIVSVKGNDYRIHFWYISKDEVINIMTNPDLSKKVNFCKNIKKLDFFLVYI